jgi:hypothetical protein
MSYPRGSEVTVLRSVDLPGVSREARLVRVKWPSGTTQRRMQIAGRGEFDEVEG